MSIDATRWAWQQKVSPTQKLVLLSLADRADENNLCYPSIARLESDTGLYRETIFEAIKSLEEMKLLLVERQLGKGNRYTLIGVNGRHETSSEKPTGSDMPTSREKHTGTSREKPTAQSGKADYYQSGKADTEPTNESTNNLPIESTNKKRSRNEGLELLKDIPESLALDYLKIRKAAGKPLTATALAGIVREATKIGYTLEAAITLCCERSWIGFNAEWVTKSPKTVSKPNRHSGFDQIDYQEGIASDGRF